MTLHDAARLREAARALRERAEAATPGPWSNTYGPSELGRVWSDAEGYTYDLVVKGTSPIGASHADTAYIATMHPGVGLALADILDGLATNLPDWTPGRRLADLILGSAA